MIWRQSVAPYAGAWIETTGLSCVPQAPLVAPYAGAWIETERTGTILSPVMSPASRTGVHRNVLTPAILPLLSGCQVGIDINDLHRLKTRHHLSTKPKEDEKYVGPGRLMSYRPTLFRGQLSGRLLLP